MPPNVLLKTVDGKFYVICILSQLIIIIGIKSKVWVIVLGKEKFRFPIFRIKCQF